MSRRYGSDSYYGRRSTSGDGQVHVRPPAGTRARMIHYGFVSSMTPTSDEVSVLPVRSSSGFAGAFTLQQDGAAARYACLAFPASFGIPASFTAGLLYQLQRTAMTIDGAAYNVFINPYPTFAVSLTFTVS